jgi:hypothetical protein
MSSMLLFVLPIFALQLLPEDLTSRLALAAGRADVTTIYAVAAIGLLLLDTTLIVAALGRFQRARMILD